MRRLGTDHPRRASVQPPRKLKAIYDIFQPLVTSAHIEQLRQPMSATEAQVSSFTGSFSPTRITDSSTLLSFFANSYFAARLVAASTKLNERLDDGVKVISGDVDYLLQTCKLITANAEADWFNGQVFGADPAIRVWWDDMLRLHQKLGALEVKASRLGSKGSAFKGALGLRDRIGELEKALRQG